MCAGRAITDTARDLCDLVGHGEQWRETFFGVAVSASAKLPVAGIHITHILRDSYTVYQVIAKILMKYSRDSVAVFIVNVQTTDTRFPPLSLPLLSRSRPSFFSLTSCIAHHFSSNFSENSRIWIAISFARHPILGKQITYSQPVVVDSPSLYRPF